MLVKSLRAVAYFGAGPLRAVPRMSQVAARGFGQNVEIPSRKEFILKAKSSMTDEELREMYPDWDEQMKQRAALLKKKRVLRRYMRLKRNNFVRTHKDMLTDEWYVSKWVPKIEDVLDKNSELLEDIIKKQNKVEVSSYHPLPFEMNISPVMTELISRSKYPIEHSLPIVQKKKVPLVFRRYEEGDELVKSDIFNLMEPTDDKEQVYPNVLIVPLMGFIEDCNRIGYGGGFYDRTIEQLREIHNDNFLMIGVAFEAQRFDLFAAKEAESDSWRENQNSKIARMRNKFQNTQHMEWVKLDTDEPLDYIITEHRVYSKN